MKPSRWVRPAVAVAASALIFSLLQACTPLTIAPPLVAATATTSVPPITTTTVPASTTTTTTGPVVPALAALDRTGQTDVTAALNTFLASVANGSTVDFPAGGRYRIEGTLVVSGKNGVTIDGHGSTFFATTNGVGTASQIRTRSQWRFTSDTNLTVQNMTTKGSSTSTGPNGTNDATLEAQHAYEFDGSSHVLLTNVSASGTWGDLVNIAKQGSAPGIPSSFVTVQNSTFVGASRQGVSVTDADHVTFSNNTIDQARRSLIDLEANTGTDTIAFVTFSHNTFGVSRFDTIGNAGAPGDEHDIVIDSNRMQGAPFKMTVWASATRRRYNYAVTNNVAATLSNDPMVGLAYVDNVTVSGNTVTFVTDAWPTRTGPLGSPQAPVMAECATLVTVVNNTFTKPSGMPDSIVRPCP